MLQSLLRMFGMQEIDAEEQALIALETLLQRAQPVNTVSDILRAIQTVPAASASLKGAAVCIDTNVFFQLSGKSDRVHVVDYLATVHREVIVVSAQAVQEVWNNYFNGIDTIATEIRRQVDSLAKAIAPVDDGFGDYKERFESLLSEFKDEFGHLHQEGTKDRIRSLIEVIEKKAQFIEVPRKRFEQYYTARKLTKTPPGFKDDGAGDYFIWLDFLHGLKMAKMGGAAFERAVLISGDRKPDWVRGGVPHPTLAAECFSHVGVPLEIWNLKRLADATRESPQT
jgi:hypothetical protein